MTTEIKELEKFIKSNPDVREMRRGLAVKLSKEGHPYRQMSNLLGVSLGFISTWRQKYEAEGVAGLRLGYKGRERYLSQAETEVVIEWLQGSQERWGLRPLYEHIQESYGVVYKSEQSYYDLLKQARLSWKKTQKENPKKDEEQVEAKQAELKKTQSVGRGN